MSATIKIFLILYKQAHDYHMTMGYYKVSGKERVCIYYSAKVYNFKLLCLANQHISTSYNG